MRKSLRLRLIAAAALWVAAALIVTGVLIASLLRDFVESNFEERLDAQILALMSAVSFDADGTLLAGGTVSEPQYQQLFSGWYWQIGDEQSVLLRSASLWDQDLGSSTGNVGQGGSIDSLVGPRSEALHARYRDFTAPGGGSNLRVTVAGPRSEIDEALDQIVPPLALSLALLGAGLMIAVVAQTYFGLRPLTAIRRQIADIREGRAHRLPEAQHVELQPIISETNSLMDHNRRVVERARNHVGNLAHGLKTPLAVLANDVAATSGSTVAADCVRTMERLISHHLRRARSAAAHDLVGVACPIAPTVDDLVMAMRRIYADKSLAIIVDVPAGLRFSGDQHDLEEMLGNLIDNACKYSKNAVAICAKSDGQRVTMIIDDDGDGLKPEERERALARGVRLDERAQGSGLGLAIVRDMAELYDGALDLADAPQGGLRACLSLPKL